MRGHKEWEILSNWSNWLLDGKYRTVPFVQESVNYVHCWHLKLFVIHQMSAERNVGYCYRTIRIIAFNTKADVTEFLVIGKSLFSMQRIQLRPFVVVQWDILLTPNFAKYIELNILKFNALLFHWGLIQLVTELKLSFNST